MGTRSNRRDESLPLRWLVILAVAAGSGVGLGALAGPGAGVGAGIAVVGLLHSIVAKGGDDEDPT